MESRDRVKSALLINGFKFPPLKITINLSPSDIKKSGSHFDLVIALLIILQDKNSVDFQDFLIFGELGLDGVVKDTNSIFIIILSLAQKGLIKNILIPYDSAKKVMNIPNINIYAVKTIAEAIDIFQNGNKDKYLYPKKDFDYKNVLINGEKYFYHQNYPLDFIDVRGQIVAKRASLIAITGNHNIIFEGSAGCGKSMIAKRLQYIMPPMNISQILEKAKLEAFDNVEPTFYPESIFRHPHHSSTKASIFGGGTQNAKMGEVALANDGILFFDELPHFNKNILEALREPLEDFKILISRVNSKIEYKTKFLFVSAMNPCPCGNLLNTNKECRCSDIEIKRYKNKISEPIIDRIDIYVQMDESDMNAKPTVNSESMANMVRDAFILQKNRGQTELNGKMSDKDIKKYCILDSECENILNMASQRFNLSFRSINKIIKISRTIADLENSKDIKKSHILEGLSYRKR